jgi:hypothetical protein
LPRYFYFGLRLSFLTLFEIIVIITGVLVLSPTRSMGYKIQAAADFVEQGGERAVVCRPEGVVEALEGRGGTVVEKYITEQDRKS